GAVWVGVLDIDDDAPVTGAGGQLSDAYDRARILILKHGTPAGQVCVPASPVDSLTDRARTAAQASLAGALRRHARCGSAVEETDDPPTWIARAACPRRFPATNGAGITVVVCTRNRPELLRGCLRSLQRVVHRPLEILVVDNAPSGGQTRQVVTEIQRDDPRVRYTRELSPGLSVARNRGLAEARFDIVAFTDDDALADPGWPSALAAGFAADPDATCVTGLVLSSGLDTVSERYFDSRYPWGEAFEPRRYDLTTHRHPSQLYPFTAGIFGTGANFAVRRSAVTKFGGFDPLLGAGSPALGGEDLDWFLRIILAGGRICYLPAAFVWHRHRVDAQALNEQIYSYGHGLGAYLAKHLANRELRAAIVRHGLDQAGRQLGRMWRASQTIERGSRSWRLALVEITGLAAGMASYARAARAIDRGSFRGGP
ncbi:MAG TPA: glycosyltransferase, partial [Streptosporangiaceae bacterium]